MGCFLRMRGDIYRYILVRLIFFINRLFKRRDVLPVDFKNVLIIHNQLIGDTVVATPLIKNFKKKFPYVNVIMVVSKHGYQVLKECPYIKDFIVFDEEFNGFIDFIKKYCILILKIREYKVDLVIDLQVTFLYFTRLLMPVLSGAKQRLSFKRGGFRGFLPTCEVILPDAHVVLQYLSILDLFNVKNKDTAFEVYFNSDDLKWVNNFYKENSINFNDFIVAVHPGNKNALKRWSSEKFAELMDILIKDYKFKVIIVGSVSDEAIIKDILLRVNSEPVLAYGKTEISQLCALLNRVNLLISVDTCSVHIASALDVPTVVLYGPTDVRLWGAWNKEKQICLSKDVSCRPCEDNNPDLIVNKIKCTKTENICMKEIKVSDVLSAVQKFLPDA